MLQEEIIARNFSLNVECFPKVNRRNKHTFLMLVPILHLFDEFNESSRIWEIPPP